MAKKSSTLVITHGNCLDGFTAAWAAWVAFDKKIRVFHAVHGAYPPRCAGQVVYILDFAYPKEWLAHMYDAARYLKVIDHHASVIPDIGRLPYVTVDPSRSGAGLAWDLLVKKPRPYLIDLVEHGDLWQWEGEWEKDAMAWLALEPRTFNNWAELATWSKSDWQAIARDGARLREGEQADMRWYFDLRRKLILNGVEGLSVEAPSAIRSELGHRLAVSSKTFGLVWHRTPKGASCSIRAIDLDILSFAKEFGGGGHPQAAGFTLTPAQAARLLPDF